MKKTRMGEKNYKYDVVLSFAGEDREYVKEVAECLKANGIVVFFDEYEESVLWGKDLYTYLDNIYRNEARYCLMFLSEDYANKMWTNHERESAQARAFQQNEEYILPIKLDDTEIPGIRPTTGYLDGRTNTPGAICKATLSKLGMHETKAEKKEIPARETEEDDDTMYIPKVSRTITELEKRKFLKSSFDEIRDYFSKALDKLKKSNQHIEVEIDDITNKKFTATVYVEGELKVQCKIWLGGLMNSGNGISYAEGTRGLDINNDNSLNDNATLEDDGREIYFSILGMVFGSVEGMQNINLKRASANDVAKYYWGRFTNYLRI